MNANKRKGKFMFIYIEKYFLFRFSFYFLLFDLNFQYNIQAIRRILTLLDSNRLIK